MKGQKTASFHQDHLMISAYQKLPRVISLYRRNNHRPFDTKRLNLERARERNQTIVKYRN